MAPFLGYGTSSYFSGLPVIPTLNGCRSGDQRFQANENLSRNPAGWALSSAKQSENTQSQKRHS